MKVLLTGAAGSIGHHALEQLLCTKHTITVLEIKNKKTVKRLRPYYNKINLAWGSITDVSTINELIINQDIVIHLAGLIPPVADKNPKLTKQVNYFGTKNIVDAIKSLNKHCFLMFASSISVYGDRVDNYSISVNDQCKISEGDYYAQIKKETEEMIQKSGIEYTIFRLSAIMDVPKIDPLMFHMPLDTKLEITTARDTARAFIKGIEYRKILNHKIYNLGGGKDCRTTYRDFIKKCFKIYGLNYKHLDERSFANQNFHCGYYIDGNQLNDLIDFRRDTLTTYYKYLGNNINGFTYKMTKLLSYFIIRKLNKSSEPRKAINENNESLIARFFKH